ncbi:MAG: peptide-methionine (S)-S-oxide reductase MsrA [Mucilaginibacter sp.]|jgi:peptide-methionine (S)-S-oxide reductase|uniref:peptide-methionine (S)-S-oxide reductase MsrA n=1 Tax=Mucilaginibacter sp. TaxID=1882438 RepID=UPI0035657984
MKNILFYLLGLSLSCGCSDTNTSTEINSTEEGIFAKLPLPAKGERVATFAGGCFWSLSEALSELKGVNKVVAGYAGGTANNPTYEDVSTKLTGHAESVQVYYDPSLISYRDLVKAFFFAHDPTTPDRQGPDEGPNYRSIAFYRDIEEKRILDSMINQINNIHQYSDTVVTQLLRFKTFYPAENDHQGYYRSHPESTYILEVSQPKVFKFRKAMYKQLKQEFQSTNDRKL